MPRGVHEAHVIKSESNLERVWASVDDEGNELGYHVEPIVNVPELFAKVTVPVGPVRVNHHPFRHTAVSLAAGMAGAGIIEAILHH